MRAVPITVRTADSRLVVFRSTSLMRGDVFHLLSRHLADLGAVGLGRTLDDARGALEQLGGRRRLGDKGKAAIVVDRHQHRE